MMIPNGTASHNTCGAERPDQPGTSRLPPHPCQPAHAGALGSTALKKTIAAGRESYIHQYRTIRPDVLTTSETAVPVMRRSFWKATLISLTAYTVAVLGGVWGDFRFTLLAVPMLQITWTLFCLVRFIQLRRSGGHKTDATLYDRDSCGFSLGGLISSSTLLVVVVVLSQTV